MFTYTVTELANRCDTTPHVVRYYTRMRLLRPKRNPENGYRLYKSEEIPWLRFIQQAKNLGYTLKEIREIMHDADDKKSPCPRVRELLLKHIVENQERLDELTALQNRMEQALKQWKEMPDDVPDGHSVCHLIESITVGAGTTSKNDNKHMRANDLKH